MTNTKIFDAINTSLDKPLLIEASAGTGKTYSLMHLIIRLLIEKKIPIEKILMVTFTKSATAELSARLRSNLTGMQEIFSDSETALSRISQLEDSTLRAQLEKWIKDDFYNPKDPLAGIREIGDLVNAALAKFDDTAIFTIHGFCQRMIRECAFSSKAEFGMEISEGEEQKTQAIDTVVRRIAKRIPSAEEKTAFLSFKFFRELLKKTESCSRRKPYLDSISFTADDPLASYFDEFIEQGAEELRKLKLNAKIMCYDDMLVEVEKRLDLPDFRDAVRAKYDAVLIDEFQDTDPLQYSIFKGLFLENSEKQIPVIFVGDPKQSIYAFRAADLDTYIQARDFVNNTWVLEKNFRSAPGLVDGINTFFSFSEKRGKRGSFLNNDLAFEPVKYNNSKLPLFKKEGDSYIPLPSLEIVTWGLNSPKSQPVDSLRRMSASIIAERIAQLINEEIYVGSPLRRIKPKDITILIRKRTDAKFITEELKKRQIRYIIQSNDNVFDSEEAKEIQAVLAAMESPKSQSAMAQARATKIIGHTLKQIEQEIDSSLEARVQIEKANSRALRHGILSAFAELFRQFNVETRLLEQRNGQRALTNYRHILEFLHIENRKIKTVSGLLRWLKRQEGAGTDDTQLRLESDSDLIRIDTIHKSKGLEYPVVFLPEMIFENKPKTNLLNTIDSNGQKKKIFLKERDELAKLIKQADEESREGLEAQMNKEYEELVRLLYVAMTRASSLLVAPFFIPLNKPKKNLPIEFGKRYLASPPLQALTGMQETTGKDLVDILRTDLNDEFKKSGGAIQAALAEGVASLKGSSVKIPSDYVGALVKDIRPDILSDTAATIVPLPENIQLQCGTAFKNAKTEWIRTSFSALSRGIEAIAEESPALDELPEEDVEIQQKSFSDQPSEDYLRFKPKGMSAAAYGDFLHRLIEETDFSKAAPEAGGEEELFEFVKNKLVKNAVEKDGETSLELHARALTQMLIEVLNVRVLKELPDFALYKLEEQRKIPEMDFMLSNKSLSDATSVLTGRQLGEALSRLDSKYKNLNLQDDPINGYLVGSIDLAFFAGGKFWIIDWKSNFLKENPDHYTSQVLEEAMTSKHYKLQYLLYMVALKRYLEARLGKSDVYDLIGGAAYVFLRGIRRKNPKQGIYFDRPSKAVLECIDKLLRFGYDEKLIEHYANQVSKEE